MGLDDEPDALNRAARTKRERTLRRCAGRERGRSTLPAESATSDGRCRAARPQVRRNRPSESAGAHLAFDGALSRIGEDPEPTPEHFLTVLHAKLAVAEHVQRAIDAALESAGGVSFYRTSPLGRIARDFRGIGFHPLTPTATLFYAGRVALGGDAEEA
ncbi:MAG: hypothetical protein IT304_01380 [Dehalococcoidia bacterium]|nr:hypothetical protein [Dehalococcoidia bacterium]